MTELDILKLIEITSRQAAEIASLKADIEAYKNQEPPFRSPDIAELATALSCAQGEMPIAPLNKQNPYFKSRYADLLSIVCASRPSLAKHGLSVTQDIISKEEGQNVLYTILLHKSGQFIESRMRIVPPKNDIQTITSYTTYLKRMAYSSLIGVVTGDEDDDGEVAMIESRDILARGPSNKYNPKDQSPETITKEQLEELEYEIAEYPDIGEEILDKMSLQSLADLPKNKFMVSIQRVREIKQIRNTGKK